MDALGFETTRFVRHVLLSLVFNSLIIVIPSMTMVQPAYASGMVAAYSCKAIWWYTGNPTETPSILYNTTFEVCGAWGTTPAHPAWVSSVCYQNSSRQDITASCNAVHVPENSTCTTNAEGQKNCTCNDPYVPDPTGKSCVYEQNTLTVLEDPHPDVEPGSGRDVVVRVMNAKSEPKSGVRVRLKVDVEANTGGHDHHDEQRPKGTLTGSAACDSPEQSCITAITGSDGYASFIFSAPNVSGKHTFTAACVSPACSNTGTARIEVKVPDLHKIPDDPTLYAFIGGEADKPHHDNHYLTDSALSQLVILAINYHFLYPNDPVLHLNDASLEWGGKFDIKGNWVGDHKAHKRGAVIDIRANTAPGNIPERLFKDFMRLAKDTKLADGMTSAQAQLHCSTGYDQANYCAGDDSRHFHVILLGVDQ